ncbi:hypothetical protein BCR44DRAFT_57195 [Catenaria anguillulae PL171]|uniref:G-protein coupled receptors family 1 profile domain-containing protein n=1 Tax=Catenaria anguillulae PL171 TaxID=765915 RepID=A0A1Y2H8J5_9FUNG|nr:hypothetical protein BCR44DRAFT_57195 [Catenaria anguillulae PL171]
MAGYAVQVENRPVWDPLDFDQGQAATSQLVSNLQIIQIAMSLIMNGLFIFVAATKRHLMSNAANLLTVVVSVSNFVFALYLLSVRIRLAIDFSWSHAFCLEFAFVVVLFVCLGAFHLTAICLERYLALVRLVRVSRKHALLGVAASFMTSVVLTTLHFVPFGSAFISRAGIYCCPTRAVSWQGAIDATAMIVHFVAIFAGYSLIYMQLRRLARTAKSSMNVPSLGPTTMGNLGHSRSVIGRNSLSANQQNSTSATSKDQSTRTERVTPILGTAQLTETETKGGAGGAGSMIKKLSPIRARSTSSVSTSFRQPSLWSLAVLPTKPESRVVLRGMLSLLTYTCFVVSYSYVLWMALIHQDRPSVPFDWFLVSTKFLSDIGDPIILFVLDRQFQQALKETLGWL